MSNKKRGDNFLELEINFLIESVKSRKNVIEDKKTDSSANRSKKLAWVSIEKDFQENPECLERNVERLMAKWKGLKKSSPSFPPGLAIGTCVPSTAPIAPGNPVQDAKDTISAHRKYHSGTGGGPPPPELKEMVKEIWDMLPGQFERIPNEYDDDAGLLTGAQKTLDSNVLSDFSQDFEVEDETIVSADQSVDYEPHPKVQKLIPPPKTTIPKQVTFLNNDLKKDILEITKKNLVEKHELRIKFMKEEHDLRMIAICQEIVASQNKSNYFLQKAIQDKKQSILDEPQGSASGLFDVPEITYLD